MYCIAGNLEFVDLFLPCSFLVMDIVYSKITVITPKLFHRNFRLKCVMSIIATGMSQTNSHTTCLSISDGLAMHSLAILQII